jgi:hypothetical protein
MASNTQGLGRFLVEYLSQSFGRGNFQRVSIFFACPPKLWIFLSRRSVFCYWNVLVNFATMKCPVLPILFLLFAGLLSLISGVSIAQTYDSAFWAQHALKQPDSTLLKDNFWFPYNPPARHYIYSKWNGHQPWARKGDQSCGNFGSTHSAIFTLHTDHSFVFDAGFEAGSNLTVGRWWETSDSTLCLNWNDVLSLHLCRDRKLDAKYLRRKLKDYDFPWPDRIDHWAFVRQGDELVPLASP